MTDAVPSLDATFRCTHFACTLAVKHCLRRQQELVRRAGRGGAANPRPLHTHCAGGTCEQGNTHRVAFPEFQHEQSDPRQAPRLDIVRAVEEKTMPKTVVSKPRQGAPCVECGSTSRHKSGCSKPPRATTRSPGGRAKPVAVPRVPRRPKTAAGDDHAYLAGETIDELVDALTTIDRTRAAVVAEIRRRREAIDQALQGLGMDGRLPAQLPLERSVG